MKNNSLKHATFSIFKLMSFVCLLLCLSFFVGIIPISTNQQAEGASSTSIENYDDYIDYFKANTDDPLNNALVAFYTAFENNIEEIKSGSFEISMREEGLYNAVKSLSYQDIHSALAGAVNAFMYDNPENFFIDFTQIDMSFPPFNSIFLKYDVTVSANICYIEGIVNQNSLDNMIEQMRTERDEIIDLLYATYGDNPTDYQIVYFVNDYLVDNVVYDVTTNKTFVHTAYGALVNDEAVCDGYAYAAQYILDELGVANLVVAGKAYNPSTGSSEGHMWSYVKLYGHWYGLDVTWNDPIYYFTPSEAVYNANKVRYFLVGGDEATQTGFYKMEGDSDARVVSNYQIYFTSNDTKLTMELPHPVIEKEDYIDPTFEVRTQKKTSGNSTESMAISLVAQNKLDDMYFAYSVSYDNGATFGEKVKCENSMAISDSAKNGTYKFYLMSSDGKIVKESQTVAVEVGQKYNLTINSQEGVEYQIIPDQIDGYYEGNYVKIELTALPIGKEGVITSNQVEIAQIEENWFAFNFPKGDLTLEIGTQDKLYNILVAVQAQGVEYEGAVEYELDKTEAYYQNKVQLTINSLPIGKELAGVKIGEMEYEGELALGQPIEITMPPNDLEITILLEDIVYDVMLTNNSEYQIDYNSNAIYQQEVSIVATNLPENKKIVISGVENIQYLTNSQASFVMPADNVEITLDVETLVEHSISVLTENGVEVSLNHSQAYFGQEIFVNLSYNYNKYRVNSVLINGIEVVKVDNYTYSFIMPDEEVEIVLDVYQIPNIVITNDIEYTLTFNEDTKGYYYLITLANVPSNLYVKNISIINENGESVSAITQISQNTFRVDVAEDDLTITFNFGEKDSMPDNSKDDYMQILAFALIFIAVVAFVSLVIYLIRLKRKK